MEFINIRQLPDMLVRAFGKNVVVHEGGERSINNTLTATGPGEVILVAEDGIYPLLERAFKVYPSQERRQEKEDPYLDILIIGYVVKHDQKGDIYQDHCIINHMDTPSSIFFTHGDVVDLSCQIVSFATKLMKTGIFLFKEYRVGYEANSPKKILPVPV